MFSLTRGIVFAAVGGTFIGGVLLVGFHLWPVVSPAVQPKPVAYTSSIETRTLIIKKAGGEPRALLTVSDEDDVVFALLSKDSNPAVAMAVMNEQPGIVIFDRAGEVAWSAIAGSSPIPVRQKQDAKKLKALLQRQLHYSR